MIFTNAFTVYALGLRHGADPDHLAAIDNLTRNSLTRAPKISRFIGALFAGGHSVMVLAIAALVGYLGTRFVAQGAAIEKAGTWISIVVLIAIAANQYPAIAEGAKRSRIRPQNAANAARVTQRNIALAGGAGRTAFWIRIRNLQSNRDLCSGVCG